MLKKMGTVALLAVVAASTAPAGHEREAASRPASQPAPPAAKVRRRGGVEIQVIRLRRNDVGFVVQAVERMLKTVRERSPAARLAKLVADARTNSIIVVASPQMQERVKAIVLTLDGQARVIGSAKGEKLTVDVVREGKAKAIKVAAATRPAAGEAASGSTYERDLAAFFAVVDETYPFFDLKGIRLDWVVSKQRLAEKAKACKSDSEFLGLVIDAARCLRDGHLRIGETKAKFPAPPREYYPGISFMPATGSRVVVMYPPREHQGRLKTGTVVTKIDGRDARTVLQGRAKKAWEKGGFFSSPQRARLFEYRIPLRGEKGRRHTITCLDGKAEREVALTADVAPGGWPHSYNMPKGLTRVGRSFWHTRLPGGAGYMYIRRVDDSSEPGIRQAMKKHPGAKGWIADLRGNGGGGYDAALINAIKAMPRPVAVLIDAGCISAGETLARDFRTYAGARLFGTKSAGSSSSKRHWKFPSGIAAVSFSQRSRWRADRKPIEYNGIDPDAVVEPAPEEVAAGTNSAIRRAEEYLKKAYRPPATKPAAAAAPRSIERLHHPSHPECALAEVQARGATSRLSLPLGSPSPGTSVGARRLP